MSEVVVENVTKRFRHRPAMFGLLGTERAGTVEALKGVSLRAPAGSLFAILGPNGSGKTTLLKSIATVLLPDSGRVLVDGLDNTQHAREVCRKVGFVVANERSFFARLTAEENMNLFASLEEVPRRERPGRIREALQLVDLSDSATMLVQKFSSGMYQRLGIARALLKRPSVLLLDEPTRSLDPGAAEHFWAFIRQQVQAGLSVILATHNLQEAAVLADQIAILYRGSILAVEPTANRTAEQLRSWYFATTGQTGERPQPHLTLNEGGNA